LIYAEILILVFRTKAKKSDSDPRLSNSPKGKNRPKGISLVSFSSDGDQKWRASPYVVSGN